MRRVVFFAAIVSACRSETPASRVPTGTAWTYEVVATPGAEELAIEASFPPGTNPELTVNEGAEPFVRGVEASDGAHAYAPVAPREGSWIVPACAKGCRVRYRFALRAAARAVHRVSVARETGGAVESPPSSWLLRPERARVGTPFRFHVVSAPGESFVVGVYRARDVQGERDVYAGNVGEMFQLPYAAIGHLHVHELRGGEVSLAILPGELAHEDQLVAWATKSANVVAAYYGKMPAPRTVVFARPTRARGVGFGTTMGNAGASIAVNVGGDSTEADLDRDWVLVHEMIHTALPDVDTPQHWLEEGLATYVEPLARARVGNLSPEAVWRGWVRGMPHGLPESGDRGLDETPTWGRTYWGGALFCLLADVEIRKRTNGTKSLDDALRAIVTEGGNIGVSWGIDRILATGDRATGVPVLRELYDRMAHTPAPVDLAELWRSLGVIPGEESVTFDENAPLAALRRAMTLPR